MSLGAVLDPLIGHGLALPLMLAGLAAGRARPRPSAAALALGGAAGALAAPALAAWAEPLLTAAGLLSGAGVALGPAVPAAAFLAPVAAAGLALGALGALAPSTGAGVVFAIAGLALLGIGALLARAARPGWPATGLRLAAGWGAAATTLALGLGLALPASAPAPEAAAGAPASLGVSGPLSPDAAGRVAERLIAGLYAAYAEREEDAVYAGLAAHARADLIEALYLEQRRALTIRGEDGATARLARVRLIDAVPAAAWDGQAPRLTATWEAEGTIGHFGHEHPRRNLYRAELGLAPEAGRWKIAALRVLGVEAESDE